MPQDGVHTLGQGPWHECGRCDRKAKLESELQWQRGLLLCHDCFDKKVIGEYDQAVAQVLSSLIANPDLQPSAKLTQPTIETTNEDIFI